MKTSWISRGFSVLVLHAICATTTFAETESEYNFRKLYNSLVRAGKITAPELAPEHFWSKLKFKELRANVESWPNQPDDQGGLIANGRLVFNLDEVAIAGSFDSGYTLKLVGVPQSFRVLRHPRATRCELVANPQTSWQLSSRLNCIMLRAIRGTIESGFPASGSFSDLVQLSDLQRQFEQELNKAREQSVIDSFEMEESVLPVYVTKGGDRSELLLDLESINPHATPASEAAELRQQLASRIKQGNYLLLTEDDEPQSIALGKIREWAIENSVADASESLQLSFLKLNAEPTSPPRYIQPASPVSNVPRTAACHEPVGFPYPDPQSEPIEKVTPGNKEVAHLVGFDGMFLNFATKHLVQLFKSTGYNVQEYNLGFSLRQEWIENCSFRKAETIIAQAHGMPFYGSCGASSRTVIRAADPVGTPPSCLLPTAQIAAMLGPVDERDVVCEGTLDSSGGMVCTVSVPGSGYTVVTHYRRGTNGDLCVVSLVPSGGALGDGRTRALQVTTQCHGGLQVGGRSFLDNVVGPVTQQRAFHADHDFRLLEEDLSGTSQYCASTQNMGQEPFHGSCSELESLIVGPIGNYSVQESLAERSNRNARSDMNTAESYNAAGLRTYWNAREGGHPFVAVELAPRASVYRYRPEIQGYQFLDLSFSSAVDEASINVEVDDSQCPTPDAIPANERARLFPSAHDVSIWFNGAYPLMIGEDWGNEANLWAMYRRNQHDWRHYLTVRVKAKATNGIALVGNGFGSGTSENWVFPFNTAPGVEPWAHFNGIIPYLTISQIPNDTFEIRVPCYPALTCITPNLECNQAGGIVQNGENVGTGFHHNCSVTKYCFRRDGGVSTRTEQGRIVEDALPCDGIEGHCPVDRVEELIPDPECPADQGRVRSRIFYNYSSIPFSGGYISASPIQRLVECGDG